MILLAREIVKPCRKSTSSVPLNKGKETSSMLLTTVALSVGLLNVCCCFAFTSRQSSSFRSALHNNGAHSTSFLTQLCALNRQNRSGKRKLPVIPVIGPIINAEPLMVCILVSKSQMQLLKYTHFFA
jgi:hypothetical protein